MESSKPIVTPAAEAQLTERSTALTVALSDDESSSVSSPSRISFGTVQVREYERIVGDHPDTRIGVPLAIGWAFYEQPAQDLTDYEAAHVRKAALRMSSITRKNLLHQVFGIPEEELRNAEKEVQKIKKHREQSRKQSKVSARVESGARGFGRKIRRALSADKLLTGLAAASANMLPVSVSA